MTAAGCLLGSHPASQTKAPAAAKAPPELEPATTRPDAMDADATTPADMLAHRAESYSQDMAPAIARRSTAPISTSPAEPSLVQWGDPSSDHLSLLPGYLMRSETARAAPAQIEASASVANSQAPQLASMKTEAMPNSAAVVSAGSSNHDAPVDHARAQIASITPTVGDAEVVRASSPDRQPDDTLSAETLGTLDAKLSKRVQDYPHDVSTHFDYQLLQFVMDQPVPNLSSVSSLPDEDREMVSAVMDGLSNYRNNLRADNNMLLSRKVRPLLEMADRLRSLSDLTIPTVALCREVRGFANYEPFEGDPPHFSAGVEHPVILYCEVQNFSAQLDDSKLWKTELVQDAVLYTEGGMSVWPDKTQEVTDTARNHRQDFFIIQKIKLPSTLPMGRYLLKVTIQDKQSHHFAEATQPLMIAAE